MKKLNVCESNSYLSSIKVWSIPTSPLYNVNEYKRRFTSYHAFLVDEAFVHTPDNQFVQARIYLNESSKPTFEIARKYTANVLDILWRDNIDFWLGSLAIRALTDFEIMMDTNKAAHKLYKMCDPDDTTSTPSNPKVYRYMQVNIVPKQSDTIYRYYHYDWVAKNNDEALHWVGIG